MKHFYRLLLILFLIPAFSFAQSNYKPGYKVTLKGDTIQGFVNYKEWEKNPNEILFKTDLNSAAETLTAENTAAFGINGLEYFKSFTVNISQAQVLMSNISQGIDTSYITGTVFLHVLSTGKNVSLYNYTDNIKTRYYITDGAATHVDELVYRVYYYADNSNYVQTQTRYIDQLRYLARKYNADNSNFENKLRDIKYTADLVKVVQLINGDSGKQFTQKSLFGTRWYAGLGVTDNNMGFKGVIKFANNNSILPKVSAGFDMILNKNTQQVFIRADLALSAGEHAFSNPPDELNYSYSLSNVRQYTVSFTPQVIYNFYNADRIKVFAGGGLSINLSTYNNYYYIEDFGSGISTTVYKFPYLVGFWESVPLKTGVIINKKIEIYGGYTFSMPLTRDNNYSGNVTIYEVGVNYLFDVK